MIIEVSGTIDQDAFGKVIKAYNELEPNESIEIYLNSSGGNPEVGDAIVDVINNNCDITKLVAYGQIFSAAFDLLFKSKCDKRLLNGTIGMAHLSRVEMEKFTLTDTKETIEANIYKKWWETDKRKRLDFYKSIDMDNKELLKIKKGGDVYFQYNRLLELLNGKS